MLLVSFKKKKRERLKDKKGEERDSGGEVMESRLTNLQLKIFNAQVKELINLCRYLKFLTSFSIFDLFNFLKNFYKF